MPALQRFSDLFITPTFSEESIYRVMHDLKVESNANRNNNLERILHVEKSTSNPEHPYSSFGSGIFKDFATDVNLIDGTT